MRQSIPALVGFTCVVLSSLALGALLAFSIQDFRGSSAETPECVYVFRVAGETTEYCAMGVRQGPTSHICIVTPDNDEICLPIGLAISRRGL